MIRIQECDFELQLESNNLIKPKYTGALVTFTGFVRDFTNLENNKNSDIFYLEHYPGMTEAVLEKIEISAHKKWDIQKTTIIHRVGELKTSEQIVFIGVSSAHRKQAFLACEYIIDLLKTQAPFWKKEGHKWLDAKASDNQAAQSWIDKIDPLK